MRYFSLFTFLSLIIGYCIWQQIKEVKEYAKLDPDYQRAIKNTGIKWTDSFMKKLPKNMDTNIIVYDLNGAALKFHQYVKPVFNHDAMLYQENGKWRLHRLTAKSQDSMIKDDFAIASLERRAAYSQKDTIQSWKVKLDQISEVLSRADRVLAIKSTRMLYLFKKEKQIRAFKMNLGWSPVGNKVTEGDGKTPEGTYYLDVKYDREDEFYKSIKLSYPNMEDREIAKKKGVKPGYGILIHGTKPNKIKSKDWTAGCIALQNNDMDTLFKYVGEGTPIEVRK